MKSSDIYRGDGVYIERISLTEIKINGMLMKLRDLRNAVKQFDLLYYDGVLDENWMPTFDIEEEEEF